MEIVAALLLLAHINGLAARSRGRNPWAWAAAGVIFPLTSLLVLFLLPDMKAAVARRPPPSAPPPVDVAPASRPASPPSTPAAAPGGAPSKISRVYLLADRTYAISLADGSVIAMAGTRYQNFDSIASARKARNDSERWAPSDARKDADFNDTLLPQLNATLRRDAPIGF